MNPQHILVKWWSEGTIHGLSSDFHKLIFFFRDIRVENVMSENFLTQVWSGNASTALHEWI